MTPPSLARIDAHLRAWAGVAFALLALDLGVPADILRARAVALGLGKGR